MFFFFQAEDGIRDAQESRGLGDVYKRQAFYRLRKGKKIITPKKKLSFAENFFHMCFGKVPNKDIVKAFDVSLILYAEHSFNVSTFTARTITSSLSDIHGAIAGAIASLKGPLHGGANEEVMHMMKKIKKPENALKWINNALKNNKKICAVGTTVMRGLESSVSSFGTLNPYNGWTHKFIYPPFDFSIANSMISNFHTPKSTLLMMVSAFGDKDFILKAYKEAMKKKYKFSSYGDAMMII